MEHNLLNHMKIVAKRDFMQTGYYSSAAGMVTQFNRLDTIANNLANVNTVGYKEDNLIVGDFMRLYKESRDDLPNANQTKEGAKFINRTMARVPQIVDSYTDQSVGNIQQTNNTFDFALTKEGVYFLVKTPQGMRLTRDGSFSMSDEGKLITKEGYEVMSDSYPTANSTIDISTQDATVVVNKDGQIYTSQPPSTKLVGKGKLFIAQPDNTRTLVKEGNNLYRFDDSSSIQNISNSGAVKQGFIEKSNVNAVKMMTDMIETNRLVGMYQKAMDTQMNEMNKDAIEKLASKA